MSAINSAQELWLGLDTGGTYTDAVLLADGRHVIASAKALTTPWNLAIGIGKAIRAVLDRASRRRRPARRHAGVGVDDSRHQCRRREPLQSRVHAADRLR